MYVLYTILETEDKQQIIYLLFGNYILGGKTNKISKL